MIGVLALIVASFIDWDVIKEELDKCILVCSNCHREIHYNEGVDEIDV
jgi:hypothetical protein